LKDAPRIVQEHPARSAELYSPRKPIKEFETKLGFQVLDLSRQCGLRNVEPFRRAPIVLLLADRQKIPQVPQFHNQYLCAIY
jgi:hypothetical protein